MPEKTLPNGLPDISRLITTHDSAGKAIFSDAIAPDAAWDPIGGGIANFFLAYTTHTFPVSLDPSEPTDAKSEPTDVKAYKADLAAPQGLAVGDGEFDHTALLVPIPCQRRPLTLHPGTVLRFVDFAPSVPGFMHRTVSLDYGVVLEGTIELELDSGEKRTLQRGDSCVQRATNHSWKNVTPNEGWARMMFVLVTSKEVEVGGEKLGEELNDMPDVKSSI